MKLHSVQLSGIVASICASALMVGCASTPPENTELDQAQAVYTSASNDPKVAQAAPKQLEKASAALDHSMALEKAGEPQADVDHYAYIAIQQVAIAQQLADADAAQAYIKQAGTQRDHMMLQASQQQTRQAQMRTQDADAQAQQSQMQAQDANVQAQQAQIQADNATAQAQQSQQQADSANADAQAARMQTATATAQAEKSQQQNADLQQQLAALNAKQTNRGMVLTLGSVLFATNETTLSSGGSSSLDKLTQFMHDNPKRNVMVEGYTDSSGGSEYNQDLSLRRADAVQSALVSDGINPQRIATKGYGEGYPVASNDSKSGRQQNRRVEIVISDANGDFPQTR
jgi:outer membrane protein OmpA-like peptidoglycan-associated protein